MNSWGVGQVDQNKCHYNKHNKGYKAEKKNQVMPQKKVVKVEPRDVDQELLNVAMLMFEMARR